MKLTIGECDIAVPQYQLIYILALAISFMSHKRTQDKIIWSSFLLFCVLVELFINEFLICFYGTSTTSVNFYTVIVCTFYIAFFTKPFNRVINYAIEKLPFIFLFISIVFLVFQNLGVVQLMPYILGLLISTVLIGFYLFELFNSADNFLVIMKAPRFWLGIGIVIFTCVNFPYFFHLQEIFNSPSIWEPLYGVVQISNIGLSLSYLMCSLCLMRSKLY